MNNGRNYTVYDNEGIDRDISSDLDLIVSKTLELMQNERDKIQAIVLSGGFGRGEGGVIFKEGRARPINDYDIAAIVEGNYLLLYRKYQKRLWNISERVAREIGIKQIDIGLRNIHDLRSMPLTIENYEFLRGHRVLYGSINLSEIMPNYDPTEIPLFEGTWLFRNRGGGLLIAAKYFMPDGIAPEQKKQNFGVECEKAIMAVGDSILLLKGKYHYLHQKRKEIIQEVDLDGIPLADKIVSLYFEALENKVRPQLEKYYQRDLIQWWFEIQQIYDEFFHYFEQKRLATTFDNWIEYADLPKPEGKFSLRAAIKQAVQGVFVSHSLKEIYEDVMFNTDKAKLIAIMPLLLFGIRKNGYRSDYIEKASQLLHFSSDGTDEEQWDLLTAKFLRAWHEGGEAANILNQQVGNKI